MDVIDQIFDSEAFSRTLTRLTYEIVERNRGVDDVVVVGIRSRGAEIGKRIVENISKIEKKQVPFGSLDITLYRDDFRLQQKQPLVQSSEIFFDIDGKHVVLVDDVLFTGRTSRAALDALMDLGRPASVQLAVLIDRGHRELPIQADYVGKNIVTAFGEEIQVHMSEVDTADGVFLVKAPEEKS